MWSCVLDLICQGSSRMNVVKRYLLKGMGDVRGKIGTFRFMPTHLGQQPTCAPGIIDFPHRLGKTYEL